MDNWDHEYRTQTDYLRSQLAALRHIPAQRWKKYRLLEVVCRRCGDSILEVIDLEPYRVIRIWDSKVTKGDPPPRTWIGKGLGISEVQEAVGEWMKADTSTTLTRRGEPMFFPVSSSWVGEANELISTACECRAHDLTGKEISDWLGGESRKIKV